MNQAYRDEIDNIVKAIADAGMVSKLILFGSLARGDEQPDSDIDLCALTEITDRRPIDVAVALREKLIGIKAKPLDLLAFRAADFEERSRRRSTFEYVIDRDGVVLYDGTK